MSLIGRQPICDANYTIIGYDILFRNDALDTDPSDISITASVLERILNTFGLENVLSGYLGFLKIDIEFLKSSILTTIPKEHFVLMILESSFFDPDLADILERLHNEGYRFGINSCVLDTKTLAQIETLHEWLDYIRIDALRNLEEPREYAYEQLKKFNQKLIAFKVETNETFEKYKHYGTDYFQGYYIKRPHVIENESLSMSQEQVLQVWNQLQNDVEISEIVKTLEQNHALLLQLMQFINSSFFSFSTSIKSIRQVITLVGRKALSNWLLLMLVSNKADLKSKHPLLLMVINRTEIITGLLKLSSPTSTREELDTAYLVGMLSLIHLLLNVDHREFLHKLHVSEEIEEAMFEAQGKWGQLVTVTRHIENMDYDSIKPFIERYHIDTNQMDTLIAAAMEKVNAFDAMLQNHF
ncbi:MAG: HDOD domain-containing protein [Sulfuricurvum sp.]|nr:HDOD domain-containing protein [Sulfuricurvum sp.]MDP3023437.1 HDOD domain-containing protein [Sulfuricurvum sp.]MDP3118786.1 HDOD domain-containing protein [Sulfuricurvum sp.]